MHKDLNGNSFLCLDDISQNVFPFVQDNFSFVVRAKIVEGGIFYNFPGITEKNFFHVTTRSFSYFSFAGWKELLLFKCEIFLALSSLSNFSIVSYDD